MGHGIGPVGGIQEEDARFTVVVRVFDNQIEELTRPHRFHDLPVVRCNQVEIRIVPHGAHEVVGDADRDVEVCDLILVDLAGNEVPNIRV